MESHATSHSLLIRVGGAGGADPSRQGYTHHTFTHAQLGAIEGCAHFWTVGGNWSSWRNPIEARGQNTQTGKALSPELNPQPSCIAPGRQTLG